MKNDTKYDVFQIKKGHGSEFEVLHLAEHCGLDPTRHLFGSNLCALSMPVMNLFGLHSAADTFESQPIEQPGHEHVRPMLGLYYR